MSKANNLFEEFSSVSLKEWEEKIVKDLKGKSISELEWTQADGIPLIPYFNKENSSNYEGSENTTKSKPNANTNSWNINSFIPVTNDQGANQKALKALSEGANSLTFMGEVASLEVLLKDIMIEIISVDFITPNPVKLSLELKKLCLDRAITFVDIEGSITFDFLGNYAKKGKWYSDKSEVINIMKDLMTSNIESDLRSLTASNSYFQHAGATISQQIGIALSQGVEYFNLLNNSFSADELAENIQFEFAIGSNYFMEIAKLRAFRMCWSQVLKTFGSTIESTKINTTTSTLLWSDKQAKNNLLRATSSAMSAVLGGCDSLTVVPYDVIGEEKSSFSQRIATNVQLILKEESYFDKVVDPSNGSYFIEHLTEELAKKSWAFFQEIENNGGYIASLELNFIQEKLYESSGKLIEAFNTGKITSVGVNKYHSAPNSILLTRKNESQKEEIHTLSFLHLN